MRPIPLRLRLGLFALGSALAVAAPALAHPGHPGHEDFGVWAGFIHPLTGADHLAAMLAVGLWASLRGGRSLVLWPATFLAAMATGFVVRGFDPQLTELGVLASVVVLGLLTAAELKTPQALALGVVGAAGALHGMAHAADVGQATPGFEIGMLVTTTVLHLVGLGVGLRLRHVQRTDLVRLIGAGVAATGFVLAAGA